MAACRVVLLLLLPLLAGGASAAEGPCSTPAAFAAPWCAGESWSLGVRLFSEGNAPFVGLWVHHDGAGGANEDEVELRARPAGDEQHATSVRWDAGGCTWERSRASAAGDETTSEECPVAPPPVLHLLA